MPVVSRKAAPAAVAQQSASPSQPTGAAPIANIASLNPDNMIAGGLMDDFDGLITKARFAPWDYNGNIDHHILAAAITIKPDDGDEFVQHYSAGELDQFAPSNDGVSSVDLESPDVPDEDREGVFALRVGKKEALNNNSNFAQFLGAALEAGFDRAKLSGDIRFLEGTYAHFNRLPQKKRAGIVSTPKPGEEAKRRTSEILLITEIKAAPVQAAPTTKAAPRPGPAQPAAVQQAAPAQVAGGADLDTTLDGVIVAALVGTGEAGLAKAELGKLALGKLPGTLKAKGIKRIVDAAYLTRDEAPFLYDPESGQLFEMPAAE